MGGNDEEEQEMMGNIPVDDSFMGHRCRLLQGKRRNLPPESLTPCGNVPALGSVGFRDPILHENSPSGDTSKSGIFL